MRALVTKEQGRVVFSDNPGPQPGPNDAIVKTNKALICTSDSQTVYGAIEILPLRLATPFNGRSTG
jgi:isopropanol dehydrogenase (NADP+)